jgi:hypothetical protein
MLYFLCKNKKGNSDNQCYFKYETEKGTTACRLAPGKIRIIGLI